MIIALPDSFIGKADQVRLESFAAHLIAHGWASRWYWNRQPGPDMALHVYKRRCDERPMLCLIRSRINRAFCAKDAAGNTIAEGELRYVMRVVDTRVRVRDTTFRA